MAIKLKVVQSKCPLITGPLSVEVNVNNKKVNIDSIPRPVAKFIEKIINPVGKDGRFTRTIKTNR